MKLISNFKWRTANGREISPAVMTTPHLFNTVRCIWNSVMPAEAYTGSGNCYYFPEGTHPPEYLKNAIRVMLPTLLERPDLSYAMRTDLREMATYCAAKGFTLMPPLRNLM